MSVTRMFRSLLPAGALALSVGVVPGQGWTAASPAASPPGRGGAALGFDSARGVAVLFSGAQTTFTPPATPLGDTWEWNGASWRQVFPARSPSPRLNASMAYDPVRRRLVLFGGIDLGTGAALDDTWEFAGVSWSRIATPRMPSPRRTTLAWDPGRGRIVLVGGDGGFMQPYFNDTWSYDGATWTPIAAGSAPPAARPALGYDSRRGVLVALLTNAAAMSRIETWELGPGGWARRSTPRTPDAGRGTMAFDPSRGVSVYFDTTVVRSTFGVRVATTWEYDGANWHDATTSQRPLRYAGSATGLVFDTNLGTCVFFGGNPDHFPGRSSSLTWRYTPPATYGAIDAFGSGCPTRLGVPPGWLVSTVPSLGRDLEAMIYNLPSGFGPVFLQFGLSNTRWAGGPLPYPLDGLGLPGCQLLVSPDIPITYFTALSLLQLRIPVPNVGALAGTTFYNQVMVPDSSAPGGVGAVSGATAAVIGS